MKIGINLIDILPGKIGGMEQYIRNLIWFIIYHSKDIELFLFIQQSNRDSFSDYDEYLTMITIEKNNEISELYYYTDKYSLDIWFCPLLVQSPKYMNIPVIVTIPDIQHKFYPEFFSNEVLAWREGNFSFTLKYADAIITISNYSKKTIIEKYICDEEKIEVIYLDSDKDFYKTIDNVLSEKIKKKYDLPSRYMYYPANLWAHKNHLNLFKALSLYKHRVDNDVKLVLTGANPESHKSVEALIDNYEIGDNVIFLEYIKQEEMPYIYYNADFLVFPSLFEGFGLPVVEAMRCDCPVICSNIDCLTEIIKDGALFFDPLDPEDIYAKMLMISNTETRERLTKKYTNIVKNYSWDKSAKETVSVFRKIFEMSLHKLDTKSFLKISIIMPYSKADDLYKQTIANLLSLSYPNIECIIVKYGNDKNDIDENKFFKYIYTSDCFSPVEAINNGIKLSDGEIISWILPGDTYNINSFFDINYFISKYPDIDLLYGDYETFNFESGSYSIYSAESFDYDKLALGCYLCQSSVFVKKLTLNKYGLLNPELKYQYNMDLWLRIGKICNLVYIPILISRQSKGAANKSEIIKANKEEIKIIKTYFNNVSPIRLYNIQLYANNGIRNLQFKLKLMFMFIYYNFNRPMYIYNIVKKFIKRKFIKEVYTSKFDDGWVSLNFHAILQKKANKNTLVINGSHEWPLRQPLKLEFIINDGQIVFQKKIVEKGNFSVEIDTSVLSENKMNLFIKANKYFTPKKMKLSSDDRKLSFKLNSIYFE